jgi:hypothetical protein
MPRTVKPFGLFSIELRIMDSFVGDLGFNRRFRGRSRASTRACIDWLIG